MGDVMFRKKRRKKQSISMLCLILLLGSVMGQAASAADILPEEDVPLEVVETSEVSDTETVTEDKEMIESEDTVNPDEVEPDETAEEAIVSEETEEEESKEDLIAPSALLFAEFVPKALVRTVLISEKSGFSFSLTPASEYGDAVVFPDGSLAQSDANGNVTFPRIQFSQPGMYSFAMTQVSGTPLTDVRLDDRTWTLIVTVGGSVGNVSVISAEYALSNGTKSTEQATFIVTTTKVKGYSSDSLAKAEKVMSGLSLEEKVGQMFMVHYSDKTYTNPLQGLEYAKNLVTQYHPGMVVLFKYDVEYDTPASFKDKMAELQKVSSVPLGISVDEEGGKVVRVSSIPAFRSSAFVGPQDLKASGGLSAVTADTKDKVSFLLNLGLNMNLAPVADVSGPTGYIYARTWGGDGVENADYVKTVVEAAESSGLGASLKHFPGYGGTSSNTHNGFAVNNLTLEDFLYNDLLPFRAGIAVGNPMMMVTHNTLTNIDANNPASLSPAVYSLLREELGFDGIAITDDLNMKAISNFVGSDNASYRALAAGADVALTASPAKDIPAVLAQVRAGNLSMDRVNESCLRVLAYKAEMGILDVDLEEEPDVPEVPANPEAAFINSSGVQVSTGTFEEMFEATIHRGGTCRMLTDASFESTVWAGGYPVTLDLNGKYLTYAGQPWTCGIVVEDGGNFTITDSSGSIQDVTSELDGTTTKTSSSYENGVLTYALPNSTTEHRIDFKNTSVGSLSGNGNTTIPIQITGGTFTLQNGILREGILGGVYGSGGVVYMRGGAIVDCMRSNGDGGAINSTSDVYVSGGYLVGNSALSQGGAVYSSGYVSLSGNTVIAQNRAKNGGGACSGVMQVDGNVKIIGNHASQKGGGLWPKWNFTLQGNAMVVGNQSSYFGGGIYINGTNNQIGGSVQVYDNPTFNNVLGGIFLDNNSTFKVSTSKLLRTAKLTINSPSTDVKIPFIVAGNWGLNDTYIDNISFATSDYETIYDAGGISFTKAKIVNLPVSVFSDGSIFQVVTVPRLKYERQSDDTLLPYFLLSEVSEKLAAWSFDMDSYAGEGLFGHYVTGSDTVVVPEKQPKQVDGEWRVYLSDSVDFDTLQLIYLPNRSVSGNYVKSDMVHSNGFWSVTVRDMYSVMAKLPNSESSSQYVKSGGTCTLSLRHRFSPWNWHVVEKESDDFQISQTDMGMNLQIVLSGIHSPVTITDGFRDEDVLYSVQYYAYVEHLDLANTSGNYSLPVIDTTGGNLPNNAQMPNLKYLQIDENSRKIQKRNELVRMYSDSQYLYSMNPRLVQVDRMNADAGYELTELWILKEGCNPDSIRAEDFVIYRVSDFEGLDSIYDLHLTNDASKVSDDTILLTDGMTIRFIYEPQTSMPAKETTFYDYDITTGEVYRNPNMTGAVPTSQQDTLPIVYADTWKKGINNPSNYTKAGARLGFGNGNTAMGWGDETWNGLNINKRGTGYNGCTFGIVDGIAGDADTGYYPIYADGISAPNLYRNAFAYGKTTYRDMKTVFEKTGDTYTLEGVEGTPITDLQAFGHPSNNGTEYYHIWTNDFWPMDYVDSYGSDGHDLKFGDFSKDRRFSVNGGFPISDDGMDHNAYFGMSFVLNFTIPAGYCGPLDYCFFGDDDIWVFLDDTKVVDIGGVHSSTGEYVNLWDYLEVNETEDEQHTLAIFYTERGASGSTCWMEFTLPKVKFGSSDKVLDEGSLNISKAVQGHSEQEEFLFEIQVKDENGNVPQDDFAFERLSSDGTTLQYGLIQKGKATFSLKASESVVVPYIPKGYQYTITELSEDGVTDIYVDGEGVFGKVVSGKIRLAQPIDISFVNHFYEAVRMPDTGVRDLYEYYAMGLLLVFSAVSFIWILSYWERHSYLK